MVRAFVIPTIVAALAATVTYPLYLKIHKKIKNPNLASGLTLLCLLLGAFLPLLLVSFLAYREAMNFYQSLNIGQLTLDIKTIYTELLERYLFPFEFLFSWVGLSPDALNFDSLSSYLVTGGKKLVEYLFSGGKALSASLIGKATSIAISLFALFYFYRDGEKITRSLMDVSPLSDSEEREFMREASLTARATLKGALGISLIQGSIGGLALWVAGFSSPVFWAVIMTLVSLLPGLGPVVVLVPSAIFLFIKGQIIWATFVLSVAIGLSVLDNILRPILFGKEIGMHDLLIFFSTLGGISVFGLPGFLLGPVLTSLFLAGLRIYRKGYGGHTPIRAENPYPVLVENKPRSRRPGRRA